MQEVPRGTYVSVRLGGKGRLRPCPSDIDLLFSFSPELTIAEYGDNYFELHFALDDMFGREVDLITEKQLASPYFIENVERDKQLIYEAA